MHTAIDRLEFAPPSTAGLLRSLALAVLAHAFLLAALTWGVHWKNDAVNVTAEAELWSALPQEAAPKLVETPPEPVAPVPAPPAPVQAQPTLPNIDIALAQEKLRLKQEKDKQQALEKLQHEKLLLEKKQLQEQRDKEKKAAEEKKKIDQDKRRKEALQNQQDAKKLQVQRDANLKRITGLAGATGAPGATGNALHASGPSASYAGRIRARIKPNIVFTEAITGNPVADVEVRTAPDGTIVSRKLTQASGIKSWDEAVLKAIDKTEVLPRDLDGRVPPVLTISFRPKD